jgi:hypothetical protein
MCVATVRTQGKKPGFHNNKINANACFFFFFFDQEKKKKKKKKVAHTPRGGWHREKHKKKTDKIIAHVF